MTTRVTSAATRWSRSARTWFVTDPKVVTVELAFLRPFPATRMHTFASRFESATGTNPEELLGAALAGCFSMALAAGLEKAGHAATAVETACKVEFEAGIQRFALSCRAKVPGIEADAFRRLAEETKSGCHVAKALSAVPITLDARLED